MTRTHRIGTILVELNEQRIDELGLRISIRVLPRRPNHGDRYHGNIRWLSEEERAAGLHPRGLRHEMVSEIRAAMRHHK